MRKTIANLGRKPLTRRLIAAVLLLGTALLTAALRNDGSQRLYDLAMNIAVAIVALVILHFRWRSREKRTPSSKQVEDTFS